MRKKHTEEMLIKYKVAWSLHCEEEETLRSAPKARKGGLLVARKVLAMVR